MKIDHVAIWCRNLERMKAFYSFYFKMNYGDFYYNKNRGFTSCFLTFDNGVRVELMHQQDHASLPNSFSTGYAHLAISLGSQDKVDFLTGLLEKDGYVVKSKPRTTGDGYYESVILDPEGNMIELTV